MDYNIPLRKNTSAAVAVVIAITHKNRLEVTIEIAEMAMEI